MNDKFLHRKRTLLKSMGKRIAQDAIRARSPLGKLGLPIKVLEIVPGPRSGALRINAGAENGRLLRLLNRDKQSLAKYYLTWDYESGDIQVLSEGKFVRVEAPWPKKLSFDTLEFKESYLREKILKKSNRFIAGINPLGKLVTLGLDDNTPHYLIAGSTGSGKSWFTRLVAWQLSRSSDNLLVLIDAKSGEGLGPCRYLPNLMGPLITQEEPEMINYVLLHIKEIMLARYKLIKEHDLDHEKLAELGHQRIIIFLDEIQELIDDKPFLNLFKTLAAQGRAAGIHLIVSTQAPTAELFKDRSIKPNLRGRIALKTSHAEASRAALGVSEPQSNKLGGSGEAYVKNGSGVIERVQLGFVKMDTLLEYREDFNDDRTWPEIFELQKEKPSEETQIETEIRGLLNENPIRLQSLEDQISHIDPEILATILIGARRKLPLTQIEEMLGEHDLPKEDIVFLRKFLRSIYAALMKKNYKLYKEKEDDD